MAEDTRNQDITEKRGNKRINDLHKTWENKRKEHKLEHNETNKFLLKKHMYQQLICCTVNYFVYAV